MLDPGLSCINVCASKKQRTPTAIMSWGSNNTRIGIIPTIICVVSGVFKPMQFIMHTTTLNATPKLLGPIIQQHHRTSTPQPGALVR